MQMLGWKQWEVQNFGILTGKDSALARANFVGPFLKGTDRKLLIFLVLILGGIFIDFYTITLGRPNVITGNRFLTNQLLYKEQ